MAAVKSGEESKFEAGGEEDDEKLGRKAKLSTVEKTKISHFEVRLRRHKIG